MAKFGGVDFIDFDSQLNDEEKLVRQTARQFVENEIIPIIEKQNREAFSRSISCRSSASVPLKTFTSTSPKPGRFILSAYCHIATRVHPFGGSGT